jgi:hypothetical protein
MILLRNVFVFVFRLRRLLRGAAVAATEPGEPIPGVSPLIANQSMPLEGLT